MTSLKLKGKTGDQHSFSRGFKIYAQNENTKTDESTLKKPIVGSKGTVLTAANDSKGPLKISIKIKGKRDGSENKTVQRKPLSDLSNHTSFVSSTKVYDGSKSTKNERSALLERVSVASSAKTVTVSSRRSFKGKERDHLNRGAVGVHTSRTESMKDLKTSLSVQSVTTKKFERKSVITTSRTTKNSLPPTRKSLPVLKKEKATDASRITSYESASQQTINVKNHLSRNRERDSSVMMAAKSGSNSAAHILPRSFKPIVKTALRPSNAQRASKSKFSTGFRKPVSVAAISSKKAVECTLPENNVAAVSSEASENDLTSNGNNDASINMPDILAKKKARHQQLCTAANSIQASVKDLISISAEAYTSEQMLKMEKTVLKELKFRLNVLTSYVFMLRFIKAAQSDTKLEHLAFYLIELCLVEYEALKFKPSLLCASAIYVARCTLEKSPYWTPLLCRHTHYNVSEIRECAEMILRFQRAASSGQLKVTFEKYKSHDLSRSAVITPLDRLP